MDCKTAEQIIVEEIADLYGDELTRVCGAIAINRAGKPCGPLTKSAKKWCIIGFLCRAAQEDYRKSWSRETVHVFITLNWTANRLYRCTVSELHDRGEPNKVMDVLRKSWVQLREVDDGRD
jgi:hypothetical protein